jgi:murein peptide amidase A
VASAVVSGLVVVACGGGGESSPQRPIVVPASTSERHVPQTTVRRTWTLGRSAQGRALRVVELGNPAAKRSVLVVGCIHGTECAGTAVANRLIRGAAPREALLWIVPDLDPDGHAGGTRLNGRGVDLNRNFPSEWRPMQRRGDPQYSGPRPLSEPETRAIARFVRARRPRVSIWFHQPQALVRAWGPSVVAAQRDARLARVPFRRMRWPAGTASNWQNHRFPGTEDVGDLHHASVIPSPRS